MASERLKSYLKNNCLGRENAKKGAELEAIFHISRKELHRQVNLLRKNECPVCSGPDGYFYARNAGELFDTVLFLQEWMDGVEGSIRSLLGAMKGFTEAQHADGTDG